MMRNAAILLGAFLLGFLPPFVRTLQLKQELAEARQQIDMAETRELAALSYLEVTRNNYGVASGHATRLFDRLNQLATSGEEPIRSVAANTAAKRDNIMKLLATADPTARTELQDVVGRLMSEETQSRARTR